MVPSPSSQDKETQYFSIESLILMHSCTGYQGLLKTSYLWDQGGPIQRVTEHLALDILAELAELHRLAQFQNLATDDHSRDESFKYLLVKDHACLLKTYGKLKIKPHKFSLFHTEQNKSMKSLFWVQRINSTIQMKTFNYLLPLIFCERYFIFSVCFFFFFFCTRNQ